MAKFMSFLWTKLAVNEFFIVFIQISYSCLLSKSYLVSISIHREFKGVDDFARLRDDRFVLIRQECEKMLI